MIYLLLIRNYIDWTRHFLQVKNRIGSLKLRTPHFKQRIEETTYHGVCLSAGHALVCNCQKGDNLQLLMSIRLWHRSFVVIISIYTSGQATAKKPSQPVTAQESSWQMLLKPGMDEAWNASVGADLQPIQAVSRVTLQKPQSLPLSWILSEIRGKASRLSGAEKCSNMYGGKEWVTWKNKNPGQLNLVLKLRDSALKN